jgi:heat-inducible transcriptional repressor
MQLSERQILLLREVVLAHHSTGRPVGSKLLVDRGVIDASASTVRAELGRLEELGLLEHPHTSAGRVPTDTGYRLYVDRLMRPDDDLRRTRSQLLPVAPTTAVQRVEEELQRVTQELAEATELLAIVTAPERAGAVVRHVEVLQLSATRLVVVCITETGDVTRNVINNDTALDPGLVAWVGEYLNERLAGVALGQNLFRQRLRSRELGPRELAVIDLIEPAFAHLLESDGQELLVGGSSDLLSALGEDVRRVVSLVAVLEERHRLLSSLRDVVLTTGSFGQTTTRGRVEVRIGAENQLPELRTLSLVGASYGLATRQLGMVGLIGPRSLDYATATAVVGMAARHLSAVSEELYET